MDSNTNENMVPTTLTRVSMLSGKEITRVITLNPLHLERYETGKALLQECFPYLSPADREWIKTGITDEEWKGLFGSGDD